jgi:hypothetical protein
MNILAKALRIASLAALGAVLNAHAGGPLAVSSGCPAKYSGSVTLNYDAGTLGTLSKAEADTLVTNSVALWTNVTTATATFARGADLPVDVNASNYTGYLNSFSDGINPVIYDSDGSIVDDMFGLGAKEQVLGFAGSQRIGCQYTEGRAVISGYIPISTTSMGVVFAHEMGHLIGMDHSQLDNVQGLASSNYPLMYPIAYRGTLSLHADDIAAVSALYPDATLSSVYGEVSGNLLASGSSTPILGANIWARENTTAAVYSIVSDYLVQGNGYFKLLLPAGTYTLRAEAIRADFIEGSSVGPYSEDASSPSFQSPLWVGGSPMAVVTLGGGSPVQVAITPGCAATVSFSLSGAGSVTSSNCSALANASISLGSSVNPSASGQSVTFTASVSGGSGTPTGTVNFRDNGVTISGCGAVALNGMGVATCATSSLSSGSHPITAVYSGNGTYNTGTSSTLPQTVANPLTPSITLGSTANPSTVGQYVTYTGVVSGSSGTPTGTIVFRDNGAIINGCGGLVMANGRASCTIGNQALGTHSMTAVYSGNGTYSGITSSTLPQVVNAAKANTPSITLGSSVNPSTVGQYVELTAVVSGAAGTPTGTLVFRDNGETISGCGGLAMANGRATCTVGSLTQGAHSITTVYSGNATYNGVTSSTLPQTVNAAKANTPSFTLGSSQNPSVSGNVVTFTAVLSGPAGTPTGNVVFRENGVTISGCGGLALVNGRVSCSPMLNGVGIHSMTAIYLGDANYNGITSSAVPQNVQ